MHPTATPARDEIRVRDVRFAPKEVRAHYRADGAIILTSCIELAGVEANIIDYLERWSREAPDRIFLAQRGADRRWETLTYEQAWTRTQAIGQAMLDHGLTQDTPIAILSGASIEHAMVTFAGMLVGVPVAPISPSYSLIPAGIDRLREIAERLGPALVFVQSAGPFARARELPALAGAQWLSATPGEAGTDWLGDWIAVPPEPAVAKARAQVTPHTVAKILFTSGSTGSPKGVINTQGMLCSAIAASVQLLPCDEPPVQIDWLPWHHTMGGNTTLHGALRDGGTLYIDDGRPTSELFGRTLENIKDVRPTVMQSVPAAYQMLVAALAADPELRTAFFQRLKRISYAGASLPQETWERMQALAVETVGEQIAFGSGYGTTETAPGIAVTHWASQGGGEIGLPAPGLEIKLLPIEDRYEIRVRGPNVTPGYLGQPEVTAQAFDEEGFYRVGDLVQFVDPCNPAAGLRFAGRLSENFKLTNGSWVTTGDLRQAVLAATQPLVSDLVVAGHDRDDIRLMVWPHPMRPDGLDPTDYAELARAIAERLGAFNAVRSGGTQRIAAFRILHEPPSLGANETTDKAYVNQRGVLQRRAALVEELYAGDLHPEVVRL
jgi:feruloyl-CoA synthase